MFESFQEKKTHTPKKSSGEWTISRKMKKEKEKKNEKARGLDRKIRKELGNGNETTALKFQTGGPTLDIHGLTSGGIRQNWPFGHRFVECASTLFLHFLFCQPA